MKTCALVYNPQSGKMLKPKHIEKYLVILNEYNYITKVYKTERKGHAKEIVSNLDKVDLVISIGGDGTFNEVMTGNLIRDERLILSHIPVGTTNDIGAMFGYGLDPIKNLKKLLNGQIKEIDVPLINGQPFVYVAGFGKFMHVPYDTPRYLKKRIGYMAYLIEGLKDFFKPTKLHKIKYEVNGIKKEGYYSFVLISNATQIAGIKDFYKDVKLDDDSFEVLFCNFKRRVDIIKTFSLLMLTDIKHVSGIEFYKTNEIKIEFDNMIKSAWTVDGEKLEDMSNKYNVVNKNNIKIMLPNKNVDKIFKNKRDK